MRRAASSIALALALALALVLPRAAAAASVTLSQTAQPATYKVGHSIAVAGLLPGMKPEAVSAALTKALGDVQTTRENLGIEERGVAVATQTYVTRMFAGNGAEQVTVWFATPTTGNGVVQVTDQRTYPDPAASPLLSAVRAQLVTDYGPPALDTPGLASGEVKLMAWSYKGDKPAPCPADSCRADIADGLNVADLAGYGRAVKRGHDLTVLAMVLTSLTDPERASGVVVTVSDTATKLRTLDEAIRQMRAAAAAKPRP